MRINHLGPLLHVAPTDSRIWDWIYVYGLTGAKEQADYWVRCVRMSHAEYKLTCEFLARHGRSK